MFKLADWFYLLIVGVTELSNIFVSTVLNWADFALLMFLGLTP